jgi:phosphoenolpyruvate carboxykinase (ATP)
VFNLEGGCYAKLINLSAEQEPEIFAASNQFGAIMENVDMNPETHVVDYASDRITENTRSSYPLSHLSRVQPAGKGGHPNNVVFLTADAFGVLPPVARLTPAQASYYFISGYTAKVAGTEMGVKEPTAAFSTCFGAPFMPLHPTDYGTLLAEKIRKHNCSVWLVNTGWMGGAYGTGKRISLKATRAILHAIQNGSLDTVNFRKDSNFGFDVPTTCPNVESELLDPSKLWKNAADYTAQAKILVSKFKDNFKQYAGKVSKEITTAGPVA